MLNFLIAWLISALTSWAPADPPAGWMRSGDRHPSGLRGPSRPCGDLPPTLPASTSAARPKVGKRAGPKRSASEKRRSHDPLPAAPPADPERASLGPAILHPALGARPPEGVPRPLRC